MVAVSHLDPVFHQHHILEMAQIQWSYPYPRRSRDNQTLQAGTHDNECMCMRRFDTLEGRFLFDMAGGVDLLCLPAEQNSDPSSSSQKSEVINP